MNRHGLSRRELLRSMSSGFGYLAFAGLTSMESRAGTKESPLAPGRRISRPARLG